MITVGIVKYLEFRTRDADVVGRINNYFQELQSALYKKNCTSVFGEVFDDKTTKYRIS